MGLALVGLVVMEPQRRDPNDVFLDVDFRLEFIDVFIVSRFEKFGSVVASVGLHWPGPIPVFSILRKYLPSRLDPLGFLADIAPFHHVEYHCLWRSLP